MAKILVCLTTSLLEEMDLRRRQRRRMERRILFIVGGALFY